MRYQHSLLLILFLWSCTLGDMYNQEGDATEPEWVKTEREQFTEFRDKNKDGKMDKEETRDWILPSDYDHAEAEAKHLVYESDADKVRAVTLFQISKAMHVSRDFYFHSYSLNIEGKWNMCVNRDKNLGLLQCIHESVSMCVLQGCKTLAV